MKILLALLTGFIVWAVVATVLNIWKINEGLKKDLLKREQMRTSKKRVTSNS